MLHTLPHMRVCMCDVRRTSTRAGCVKDEGFLLHAIYASYVQTRGGKQGVYWDAASMEALASGPAMKASLQVSAERLMHPKGL